MNRGVYRIITIAMSVFIGLWVLFTLLPFYFQFITGMKEIAEVNRIIPTYWPEKFMISNVRAVFADELNIKSLIDSTIIATANTILAVLLGSLAGYALARYPRQAGGEDVAFWILSNRMFPPVAVLLPLYFAFERVFGSTDHYGSLVVLYLVFNLPLATWLMMVFFRDAPRELEEASYLDGFGPLRTFFRVTLPLVIPGMISVAMLCWIFAWNEYLFAQLFVGQQVVTQTIQIPTFVSGSQKLWNLSTCFSMFAMLPPLFLFIILRRYMVRGLSLGVVKG